MQVRKFSSQNSRTNHSLTVVLNVKKMKLSEHNLNTLMIFLQQKIEENAEYIANELTNGDSTDFLTYPPNGGLTEAEESSLGKIKNDPNLESALRKILADNSAGV